MDCEVSRASFTIPRMVHRDDREALAAKNEVLERELDDRSRALHEAQSELQETSSALAEKERELERANRQLAQVAPHQRERNSPAKALAIIGVAVFLLALAATVGAYLVLSAPMPVDPPVG